MKVWWGLREEGGEGGGGGLMGDWRSSFHSWTSQPRKTCHRFSPSGWFTFVLIWESLSMLTFYSWTSLPRKGVSSSLCNFILLGGFGQTQWHFAFCTSPLTFIPVCQKSINISQFYQNLIKVSKLENITHLLWVLEMKMKSEKNMVNPNRMKKKNWFYAVNVFNKLSIFWSSPPSPTAYSGL